MYTYWILRVSDTTLRVEPLKWPKNFRGKPLGYTPKFHSRFLKTGKVRKDWNEEKISHVVWWVMEYYTMFCECWCYAVWNILQIMKANNPGSVLCSCLLFGFHFGQAFHALCLLFLLDKALPWMTSFRMTVCPSILSCALATALHLTEALFPFPWSLAHFSSRLVHLLGWWCSLAKGPFHYPFIQWDPLQPNSHDFFQMELLLNSNIPAAGLPSFSAQVTASYRIPLLVWCSGSHLPPR